MKEVRLPARLQAAADFVTPGFCVADVGTDHGFLPIYLVKSGKCPRAVAMDIRKGPLGRAQAHIEESGLGALIKARLSDGIRELAEGEADSIVIAGMGGMTMLHILEDGRTRLAGIKELVLAPQSEIAKVRRYVREHNMHIDKEGLVLENGKFYPVLHVVHGSKAYGECMGFGYLGQARYKDALDQYGECLVCAKHPLLKELLKRDKERALGILCRIKNGFRIQEVKMQLEGIRLLQAVLEAE